MKLYEINEQIEKVLENVNTETGELDMKALDALEMKRDEKVLNIAKYIKSLKVEADAVKSVEKGLTDRRKALENKAERIKDYLSMNIKGETYKDAEIKISWRKSVQVSITDPETIPESFRKITVSLDKISVKEALKEGLTVQGAELVEKQNIQIK